MFTAACRFTVRMAIPALVLLCLNGTAAGADARQRQPESGLLESGHAVSEVVSDFAGQGSALEIAFSRRAGKTLRLFGYEVFATIGTASPPAFGTAQNDYLLGPGDEVRVTIHGGKYDSNRRYTVNSNGDVIVDQLRPLAAAGRTLGDLRRQIEREVEVTMSAHEAFVSLDGMRRMGILVTGAVTRPGRHEVTGSATLLDALTAAGGVDKLGSLRDTCGTSS
jgi:polysaccharide export outer membrane protein